MNEVSRESGPSICMHSINDKIIRQKMFIKIQDLRCEHNIYGGTNRITFGLLLNLNRYRNSKRHLKMNKKKYAWQDIQSRK